MIRLALGGDFLYATMMPSQAYRRDQPALSVRKKAEGVSYAVQRSVEGHCIPATRIRLEEFPGLNGILKVLFPCGITLNSAIHHRLNLHSVVRRAILRPIWGVSLIVRDWARFINHTVCYREQRAPA